MKKLFHLFAAFFCVFTGFTQSLTHNDYERAVSFLWSNVNNQKVFNVNPQLFWSKDSVFLFFSDHSKTSNFLKEVQLATNTIRVVGDLDKLTTAINSKVNAKYKVYNLPLETLQRITTTKFLMRSYRKKLEIDFADYSVKEIEIEKEMGDRKANPSYSTGMMSEVSPDGKWEAYAKDGNLFIKSIKEGTSKQLSTAGKKDYEYATYYEWGEIITGENGVRPPHFDVSWSPDSKWIYTTISDFSIAKKMYLLDYSIDSLFRPKLLSYFRGSPGDTDMIQITPVLFNIETGKETVFHEFRNVHGVGYRWGKDSSTLFFKEHTRGYQQMNIYNYNLREGIKKRIYHETSSTNIDNFESDFSAFDSTIILITSERSGWRQLYLQSQNEEHLVPLTQGEYFINNVVHLNKTTREVYFTASGKESDNPYHQYLYKVNINTKKVTLLTPEKGNHEITFSRDYNYFIDNISALDLPTQTVLKKTNDGAILQPLTKADVSELTKANYPFPAAFSAIGRDGKTTIYGAMWKPSNFDPQKKYPVIDNSYTGPHTFVFPNRFNKGLTSANQALAELGFIVVVIDGMGTANRSKSFHNVSYKNMGKNLTDHVIAIQYLAKKYKYIDDTRVGIFGHSAGGYDAGHALLEFPDFYKVGVASSADHDFRMEKDWWPEMYMGWPVDSSYHAVSNITMAPNLKGKLLLVHGGIDENVNPSATFKLAEALIKADKEFDLLIIPSQRHGYNGKYNDYFTKKKWNYFVEHLLGKKPIWEVNLRQ